MLFHDKALLHKSAVRKIFGKAKNNFINSPSLFSIKLTIKNIADATELFWLHPNVLCDCNKKILYVASARTAFDGCLQLAKPLQFTF